MWEGDGCGVCVVVKVKFYVLPYAADTADSDDTWCPSYLEDLSTISLNLQFQNLYKSTVLKKLL